MKLILVRHGATEWSVSGQHTGRTNIELTEQGRTQAHRAAKAVRKVMGSDFATAPVFSSPLARAKETAQIIFGSGRVRFDNNLMEFDYGDYEGLTSTEIRLSNPTWEIWNDGCPNGETCDAVGMRADSFLQSIERSDATVVAVAHGHLIRILAARAIGLPGAQGQIFTLDTATISIIEDVRGKRAIKMWNLDPVLLT
jgi:broad specificity phosphatase PhoE